MTDYGRDPGSEQWHPEGPPFGEEWGDQPPQQQGGWDDPYATRQHQQQPPPQYQQQPQPQYPRQQQYSQWDTASYGTGQGEPYTDSYAGGEPQPDFYGQGGYPPAPPQPYPQHDSQALHTWEVHEAQQPQAPADWDADPELLPDDTEHAFFSGRQDNEDDDVPTGRRTAKKRGGKGQGGKKRRSGMACLVVLLVLGGGVGGVGYFGYTYYQSHFGPAPDFSGNGSTDVQVEIPSGATATSMGNILKKAEVVASVDAFITAANENPKSRGIQAGIYVLHKKMSASAAVTMMLNPKAQNALIVAEGLRATQIYAAVDKKLGLKSGTTQSAAKGADLGLPSWANGQLEGFLFPAKYPVGKSTKPVELLKQMVKQAEAEYTQDNLTSEARKTGKTPYQIVTIASLIQAEAQQDVEFGKVSRVIYNRLEQGMSLGFDSTINYALGRSTLSTSTADTQLASPYNTYLHKGLTPGPIDNPGHQAIDAALRPSAGNWLYFVTVKPGDTRFAADYAEHQKNVEAFNQYQREHGG